MTIRIIIDLRKKYYFSALVVSGLFFLSACTAGSMRVDIEVYKGPLSKTREIQIGELKGYVADTMDGLENFIYFKDNCDNTKNPNNNKFKFGSCTNFFSNLETLKTEFQALNDLWKPTQGFTGPANHLKETLQRISHDIDIYESYIREIKWIEGRLNKYRGKFDFSHNDAKEVDELNSKINSFEARIYILDDKNPINIFFLYNNFIELTKLFRDARIIKHTAIQFEDVFEEHFKVHRHYLKISEMNDNQRSMIKIGAQELDRFEQKFLNELLETTATLASRLHSSSFYWSSYANFRNLEGGDRFFITEYTTLASEYSNQISSRTDALQKQLVGDSQEGSNNGRGPLSKEEFPLSAYLRDTRPTDFTELYHWQESSGKLGSKPNDYSDNDIDKRINAFKHIFDDHFWSNINTVYASGGGDAHMAFVKDEIGNWTLKSFESDPTELVQAYKKLTLAALKAATDAAVTSGTGGVSPEMLATIGKLMSGRTRQAIDPGTQVKIDALKKQTIKDLEGLKSQTDSSVTITKGKKILKDYENKLKVLQGS